MSGTVELDPLPPQRAGRRGDHSRRRRPAPLSAITGDGTGTGSGQGQIPMSKLGELVELFNERYGAKLGDTDALKVVTDVRDAVRDTNPQLADVDPDTKTGNPDNEGSGVGLGPAGAREHLRSRSNRHPRKPGQRGQC